MRPLTTLLLLLLSINSIAGHLIGGEMNYECLGDNRYIIRLIMYRDCYATGPNVAKTFDDVVYITSYQASNNQLIETFSFFPSAPDTVRLPLVLDVPCLSNPPDLCVAEMVYEDTVTLEVPPGGVHLVNQRCCRTSSTLNIVNPVDFGSTYYAFIPDSTVAPCNSSARFNQVPPKALCSNIYLDLDYSATDPDGDSLVYSLCTPYHGGSSGGTGSPAPNPPSPPPFDTITWALGYDAQYQIPSSPRFEIDSATGIIHGRADQLGTYTFAVCVQEYRDGVFLTENRRDFQMTTTFCEVEAAAAIDSTLEECIGLDIQFFNLSTLGDHFEWDFGDTNSVHDTSTAFNPSYTFPDTGLYNIRLIANGQICHDTTYLAYRVLPRIEPYFDPPTPDCFDRHSYDFVHQGYSKPSTVVTWDFGFDSLVLSKETRQARNIQFTEPGEHEVTLYYTDFGCLKHYMDTVSVYPNPQFELLEPFQVDCSPFKRTYSLQTTDAYLPRFAWLLDSTAVSQSDHSQVSISDTGFHDFTIIMMTDSMCIDTVLHHYPNHIQVIDTPISDFYLTNLSANMYEPFFSFYDQSINAVEVKYSIEDSLLTRQPNLDFALPDTGNYPITQVAIHANGCRDTSRQTVRVEPEYLVFTPNAFSPDGDGINDMWFPKVFVWNSYDLVIYDRWGHPVFESQDPRYGWNGAHLNDGKLCPIGVYAYDIHIVDNHDREWYYNGTVHLIR